MISIPVITCIKQEIRYIEIFMKQNDYNMIRFKTFDTGK